MSNSKGPAPLFLAKNIRVQLQKWATEDTCRYIIQNLNDVMSVDGRVSLLEQAAKMATSQEGLILEFGVYSGQSINLLAKLLPDRRIEGFDSFNGLPEKWRDGFNQGAFNLEGPPSVEDNVNLHVGLFEETIQPFLGSLGPGQKAALIHVDCDLYSSAKFVLESLDDAIEPGTLILFDEYFNYHGWRDHEFRAFREFIAETGRKYKYVSYNFRSEQVLVQIT